jgi:nucleoside phosphorylase
LIVCAGNNETFSFAVPVGVGLIESTINMTRICLFDKPKYILFIGSAGSYGDHNILDIVESSSAANLELSFLSNNSYTPIDNVIRSEDKRYQNDTIINSSNYITTDDTISKKYKAFNIGLENMEFFSIVSVAKEFNIDVRGIFVITNYSNKNAHRDFISNHNKAMDKLVEYLQQKNIIVSNVPRGTA